MNRFSSKFINMSLTLRHWEGQEESLLSLEFFLPSSEHSPPWTASNSTGFRSPYSPDATSMTRSRDKTLVTTERFQKDSHTQGHEALTEICRVVICGAVKTQVLQIWDEVRDCALVNALTLAEDVQLISEQKRQSYQHFPAHCLS